MSFEFDSNAIIFGGGLYVALVIFIEIAMRYSLKFGTKEWLTDWKSSIRLGYVMLLVLANSVYLFTGGFWTAGKGYELPQPEPQPVLERSTAPQPDISEQGEEIQEEHINNLEDFREEFLRDSEKDNGQ